MQVTEIGEAQKSRILGLPATDAQEKRIEVLAKKAGAAKAKAGPKAAPKKKRFEPGKPLDLSNAICYDSDESSEGDLFDDLEVLGEEG